MTPFNFPCKWANFTEIEAKGLAFSAPDEDYLIQQIAEAFAIPAHILNGEEQKVWIASADARTYPKD